jgi:hypothetical protein
MMNKAFFNSLEAAARPKVSGYGRRRRGSEAANPAEVLTDVSIDAVKIRNHGQYGDLARRQPLSLKQQRKGGADGGKRRRRSTEEEASAGPDVLLVEVNNQAVKIRNRGKYGNVAQAASHPAMVSSRLIFDDKFGQAQHHIRQRRSNSEATVVLGNFIPFSEYDARRVQILKVEQNDFLALPKRLADKDQQG